MVGRSAAAWMLVSALPLAIGSCKREQRRFEEGTAMQGTPDRPPPGPGPYGGNAWAMSEGARLYRWFNCVGCHAHGGGGMGPPLMDGKWRYGADPAAIFASIADGRPNGMPSFRARLSVEQVWQLVAYVRSLSGLAPSDAAPGRGDELHNRPPPSQTSPQGPVPEHRT